MTADNLVEGSGHRFSDGREVAFFDLGDSFGMRFTQSDKSETHLRLTKESMKALVRLYISAHDADLAIAEGGTIKFGRCA